MKSHLSSLVTLVAAQLAVSTTMGNIFERTTEELVECTVFTIASTTRGRRNSMFENNDYVCKTKDYTSYKIHGDVKTFLGESYQSSQTKLKLPLSKISDQKVINLNDDQVASSITATHPPRSVVQKTLQGSYKVLIIRVKDKKGDKPLETKNQLYGIFFNKDLHYDVSVKSVFSGCSAGKFEIIPATGSKVTNGVIDITVNYAFKGQYYSDISDDVEKLIPKSGIDDYMFTAMIFPESVNLNAAGRGNMPGTFTWYMTGYVNWVYLGIHEIGHNLGFGHSGADSNGNGVFDDDAEVYDDNSCQMGGEWGEVTDGQKCFNAAKTFYSGWFSDYQADITPVNAAFGGTLVGVNDAGNKEISTGQYVTVRIKGSGETNLYLMYNRVEGVNKFTEDKYIRDKVIVVQQYGHGEYSWVMAVLDQGETYTQSNWADSGSALKIEVCYMTDGTPDIAQVAIWLKGVNSVQNCISAPTISPAPTPLNNEIKYVGNPCGVAFPQTGLCKQCTGDCDYDSDCEGDMICFQRSSGDLEVPGCVWGKGSWELKKDDSDYCIQPPTTPTVPTPTAPTPSAPTPSYKEIRYVGNPCGDAFPQTGLCEECTGDCDYDSDCEGDMVCLQRYSGDLDVPGCVWGEGSDDIKNDGTDICVKPNTVPGIIGYVGECDSSNPCGLCKGDCDSNSGCEAGLKCFQRDGHEAVPNCIGEGGAYDVGAKDICYSLTGSTCEDSTLRFKVENNGKKINRDCAWVKKKPFRCNVIAGANTHCPKTCDRCSVCEDATNKFKLFLNGKNRSKNCSWVAKKSTNQRCKLDGVSGTCRETCGTC
jgi:hypothetical protein